MKKVYELIKYSDLDDEKSTRGDLYEYYEDAKKQMNTMVEMFLDVMKNFTEDISCYRVEKDSFKVEVIDTDPSTNRQIVLGFEIKIRKLH